MLNATIKMDGPINVSLGNSIWISRGFTLSKYFTNKIIYSRQRQIHHYQPNLLWYHMKIFLSTYIYLKGLILTKIVMLYDLK